MTAKPGLLLSVDRYELTAADKRNNRIEKRFGILEPSDRRLTKQSKEVNLNELGHDRVLKNVSKLYMAATGQRNGRATKHARLLVGIAAPQLGIMECIIMIDTSVREDRRRVGRLVCLVNPKIIWRSRENSEGIEGCFSAGPVRGIVRRPVAVKISAYTPEGKYFEKIYEGFTARIVQHEIDHLNGVRFPERIKSTKKMHWVHDEELPVYAKSYRHWQRLCSLERWNMLINK